jgi:Trypsin
MARQEWCCAFLAVALMLRGPIAAAESSRIWRTSRPLENDNRVVVDRLHARNNHNHEDYSFLNAVGAVWPDDIDKSAAGYMASTGFLIDRCHVLTSMHSVYTDDLVVDPALGNSVSFAVGQTEGSENTGALQGLKFLFHGLVIAHGHAIIVEHLVHDPQSDWALIRLTANVDDGIRPMVIGSVDTVQLPANRQLSIAGFPADRRSLRGDRLDLKDLWGSDGYVVRVVWTSTAGAIIESTIQATRGNSGSPLYGDFDGRQHIVIGMQQGIRGNGIDVSPDVPNVQLFFSQMTLHSIGAAQARSPCP